MRKCSFGMRTSCCSLMSLIDPAGAVPRRYLRGCLICRARRQCARLFLCRTLRHRCRRVVRRGREFLINRKKSKLTASRSFYASCDMVTAGSPLSFFIRVLSACVAETLFLRNCLDGFVGQYVVSLISGSSHRPTSAGPGICKVFQKSCEL